jgi:peptidoglycan/LPS O-acetylase OafA/YrhL
MKDKRYDELDVLRGFAALFVLFFHLTLFRNEAKYGFQLGITGVDLFFMISGFVIFWIEFVER